MVTNILQTGLLFMFVALVLRRLHGDAAAYWIQVIVVFMFVVAFGAFVAAALVRIWG